VGPRGGLDASERESSVASAGNRNMILRQSTVYHGHYIDYSISAFAKRSTQEIYTLFLLSFLRSVLSSVS